MIKFIKRFKMNSKLKNYRHIVIEREFIPVFSDFHRTSNKTIKLITQEEIKQEKYKLSHILKQDGEDFLVHKDISKIWDLIDKKEKPLIGNENKSYKGYKPNVMFEYDASTDITSDEMRVVIAVVDGYVISVNSRNHLSILSFAEIDRIEKKGSMRIVKDSKFPLYLTNYESA